MKCPFCSGTLLLPDISITAGFPCPKCGAELEATTRFNRVEAFVTVAIAAALAWLAGARSAVWIIWGTISIFIAIGIPVAFIFLHVIPPKVKPLRHGQQSVLGLSELWRDPSQPEKPGSPRQRG